MARLMFPSLVMKNVDPKLSGRSEIFFMFFRFPTGERLPTICCVGDDAVCGGPLESVANVSDALGFIVFVLRHSYCWLSLHRVSVISEM